MAILRQPCCGHLGSSETESSYPRIPNDRRQPAQDRSFVPRAEMSRNSAHEARSRYGPEGTAYPRPIVPNLMSESGEADMTLADTLCFSKR